MIPIKLSSTHSSRIPEIVNHICSLIRKATGEYTRALIVGGAVVDLFQGKNPKDWDIEAYGMSYDSLVDLLQAYKPKTVGKSFGIIKLSQNLCDGFDIDISIPRRENNVGVGHKDFICELDPTMTPNEAAKRRDFTINSMYIESQGYLGDTYLYDPFGGMEDLKTGTLRATCPQAFQEDTLRGLRAMQLLARKGKKVNLSTLLLIREMSNSFHTLSKERVYEELKKLLLKAEKPSIGLRFLLESGWLIHFPELHNLIGCGQDPNHHPEGDVFEHTCHVVDAAAFAIRNGVPEEWHEAFMFGTMLHDVGKPETTVFPEMIEKGLFGKERLWTAWGHDTAGVPHAVSFLERLTNNKELIERTSGIVQYHMQPWNLWQGEAKPNAYRRLHNKMRLDILGHMSRCDCCGRETRHLHKGWPYGDPDLEYDISENCFNYFSDFGEKPIEKIIGGKDLIKAGLKPGPSMGKAINAAYEIQLNGETDRDVLISVALKAVKPGSPSPVGAG